MVLSLAGSMFWGSHFYSLGLNFFIGEMRGLDPAKIPAYFLPSALSLSLLRQKAGAIAWATSINSTLSDGQPNLGNLQSSLTQRTAIFALSHQLLLLLFFKRSLLAQLSMVYMFAHETTAGSFRTPSLLLGWVGWSHWTKGLRDPPTEVKLCEFRKDDTMETSATKLWTQWRASA